MGQLPQNKYDWYLQMNTLLQKLEQPIPLPLQMKNDLSLKILITNNKFRRMANGSAGLENAF